VQNEETAMSESYHTFHLKKRGTAMKRSVQTLFLLLVLILSFSLVSCDEEETVTTTEPSERRTLATVPSFPSFTVEIPVDPDAYHKASLLQRELLNEKIKELNSLFSTDPVAAEQVIKSMAENATDSKQNIILHYGNKTIEELRAVQHPVFYQKDLEDQFFTILSKPKLHTNDPRLGFYMEGMGWFLPSVIIKDYMFQTHPEWWSDISASALAEYYLKKVENIEKIETLIAQKYKDLADNYKSLWNMLVEGEKLFDAMEQMNAQQEEYLTFLTNYQNYLIYLTRQGKSYADEIYQTKPYVAFAGEFYQKIKEQNKWEDFWGNLQQGDVVCLGSYEQDNNLENGKEPILWAVAYRDGNRVYLRSLYTLEALPWNSKADPSQSYEEQVRWDNSTIRAWLNGEFYDTAFSREEKNFIVTTDLDNDWEISDFPPELTYKKDLHLSIGGEDTEDRVYVEAVIDYIDLPIWGDYSVSSPGLFAPYTGITPYVMAKYGANIGYYSRERSAIGVINMRGVLAIKPLSKENGVRPCIQIQIPAA